MARPTKDAAEKRTERFNLRLTLAELAHVETQAAHAGIGPHDFVRRRALGHRVAPARSQLDARAVSELNRIGVNLNQLAHATHSDALVRNEASVLLAQVRGLLEQLVAVEHGS